MVWRTWKPFGEALTTSAAAGDATSNATTARYFNRPIPFATKMPQSGSAVQNRVDLRRDLFDRGHAVHPAHERSRFVIRQDRLGLGAIFGHAGADGLLV